MVDDGGMTSSGLARQLGEVVASAAAPAYDSVLVEVWAGGSFLDATDDGDGDAAIIMMFDAPAAELPWLNPHHLVYSWTERLQVRRLQKAHWGRPSAWPAWNQAARRVVRLWSADAGEEPGVINAIEEGDVSSLPVVEPTDAELLEQLRVELPVTVAHFDEVVDRYWDRDFRRELKPNPEQVLWHAARAVRDLEDAIATLS